MIVAVIVTVVVVVIVTVVVEVVLHLYFRVAGWGKERGLYPSSDLCQRTQGVGASFRLVPENQGVVAREFREL
jgi:hypothetical protein